MMVIYAILGWINPVAVVFCLAVAGILLLLVGAAFWIVIVFRERGNEP